MIGRIPITKEHYTGNHSYSLKLSEDIVQKLVNATNSAVELLNGKISSLLIDNMRYPLTVTEEDQRVDVSVFKNGNLIIQGGIDSRIAVSSTDVDQFARKAIRERTINAEMQRSSRKILPLENTVTRGIHSKKRNIADHSRQTVKQSKMTLEKDSQTVAPIKDQVVHLLAIEDLSTEDIALRLGCLAKELEAVLPLIGFQSNKLWKLKPSMNELIDADKWPKYKIRERQAVVKCLEKVNKVSCREVASELKPADITRIADQRVRQMMKSTRKKK